VSEEATIRRGTRNARYTTVPNHVFEDDRLSMEARWLLGYLLSKPDDWTVRLGDIRKKGGCGRDKARSMVAELVDAGYAEKEPARKDGKFNGLCLVIYDEPRQVEASGDSVASLPQPEKPATVQPSPANPPLVNTDGLAIPEGREREARARETEDRKIVERWLKRVHPSWPSFVSDSGDRALAAALALTAEEREQAAERMADYLAVERQNKGRCAFAVYLAEKRWERLAPKEPEKPKPAYAPAFGPVWAARRARLLLGGPMVQTPLKAWEERAIEAGTLSREAAETSARRNGGWPVVNAMHEAAAQRGNGYSNPDPVDEKLGKLCEFVPVDCDCWRAWKAEHERLGWPWLPDPGTMRGAYFPAGGPERLSKFEAAVRGEDDAGGREAAE